VRHHDKDVAKTSTASMKKRSPSAGRTTPVAHKRSMVGRNAAEKNGSQKSSPVPSPRMGRVEIGKERGSKTDTDKENTPFVPPVDLPEADDDDTVTNLHTVYTAPETLENGSDPIITPPPGESDPIPEDDGLTGRESSETITAATQSPIKSSPELTLTESTLASAALPGATLDIGIPCIISSKRKRFRAFARYIGEVVGERGPWVGVEVPIDTWVGDVSDGRAWCDGSWGGVRYFDIGCSGSEWEFSASEDSRAPRRRKTDWSSGPSTFRGSGGTKREGDQLHVNLDRMKRMRSASPAASDTSSSESMGLFVRPQQVLYVVDAVGADL
jgi:hypothetical protein